MKKLINSLAAVTLIGSSAISVIACKPKNSNNSNNNLTSLQQEMLDGAEFVSRLIVGAKHENLNYNVNEILSMFLTPAATALRMPLTYNANGQKVNLSLDLNKFKNNLAPGLINYDGDGYAGMYASYIMGMYDDDFYKNIISGNAENGAYYFEDTFSKSGNTGYNKKDGKNAMGYAAGLGQNISLSENEQRRNLAWGIQDTGALTNFLLNKGFDGAWPSDTNGTSGPQSNAEEKKFGTNGSGYAWYNSILNSGKATKSADYSEEGSPVTKKLDGSNFSAGNTNSNNKSSIYGHSFNSTGGLLSKSAGELNVNGYISLFSSMLDNFSDTKNGALVLTEFTNILFPIINKRDDGSFATDANTLMQAIGFSLITNVWTAIEEMGNADELDSSIKTKINGLDDSPEPMKSIINLPIPNTKDLGIEHLFKTRQRDKENPGANAKDIVEIIDAIIEAYEKSTNKEEFTNKYFLDEDSYFYKAFKTIISYITEESWKETLENDGAINLLRYVQNIYQAVTETETQQLLTELIDKNKEIKSFRDLSSSQKDEFMKSLGYSDNKYIEGSILERLYKGFTDSTVTGQKEFSKFFEGFKKSLDSTMGSLHNEVLQYLVDDKYWNLKDVAINSTSNTQTGAKMEFTLSYSGYGDVTSNASKQYQKVNVDQNFNPYQTIAKYQEEKWEDGLKTEIDQNKKSGEVLGLEQGVITEDQLLNYDGLGNYQDYAAVQNSYKIIWENISKDTNNPYWVITSINSYNSEGKEFFNIY